LSAWALAAVSLTMMFVAVWDWQTNRVIDRYARQGNTNKARVLLAPAVAALQIVFVAAVVIPVIALVSVGIRYWV
jgi:hypothetical protein